VSLHDLQEFHNDLRARSNEDLPLAALLGIVDGVQRIVEDGRFDHVGGEEILEAQALRLEVSVCIKSR
jgi:hypothetical protein